MTEQRTDARISLESGVWSLESKAKCFFFRLQTPDFLTSICFFSVDYGR